MKRLISYLTVISSCLFCTNIYAQIDFSFYFKNENLRLDYYHQGDGFGESFEYDTIFRYFQWAGNPNSLIDTIALGTYLYELNDEESGKLIYSKSFDSYFKEYQTTQNALDGKKKQFHETAILPFPIRPVIFTIKKRNSDGGHDVLFKRPIHSKTDEIKYLENRFENLQIFPGHVSGKPNEKVDIVIVGEGYTEADLNKFRTDIRKFTKVFLSSSPYSEYERAFNIIGVFDPSDESGIDEPRAGIDKNTSINATFNSMGSERYLLTEDNRSLRNVAANVPYDAMMIMVNHKRYGGGGIYNFYSTFTSDNIFSNYLMIHEFAHSFAGLADEYYTSSTAYTNFYNSNEEPREANITALLDGRELKWKGLATPGLKIPTWWPKSIYDSLSFKWQQKRKSLNDTIASLKKAGEDSVKTANTIQDYDSLSTLQNAKVQGFLENSGLKGQVGAFEGAGYMQKGLYRPSVNCIMFSRANYFCPVCSNAIIKTIEWHTK